MWRAIVLLVLLPGFAHAGCASIGEVLRTKGDVTFARHGKTAVLKKGGSICRRDVVTTADKSLVEIRLRDGSLVTVTPSSVFGFPEYRYGEERYAVRTAVFELVKGAFRAISGAITKRGEPYRYEVKTRVATIGVRGTDFWGGFYFSEALDVVMLEGHGVYVKNEAGVAELKEGRQGTTVPADGGAPSAPKQWGDEKLGRAIQSVSWE